MDRKTMINEQNMDRMADYLNRLVDEDEDVPRKYHNLHAGALSMADVIRYKERKAPLGNWRNLKTCARCGGRHPVSSCPIGHGKKKMCFICGKWGHMSKYCWYIHPNAIGNNNCWNCGNPGHRGQDCMERPRNFRYGN